MENERKAVYQQRELQMKQQKELIKNIIRENEKVWINLCLACSKVTSWVHLEYFQTQELCLNFGYLDKSNAR